jgi:NAD(P)-dependent dehydrogenase (short-subunit alcohol dehydrogenase family)
VRELCNRVAFVTGGVSGIGLGIANALLSAGMQVGVTYRREHHLSAAREALAQYGSRVKFMPLDVTDREAMYRAVQELEQSFGKVHVLCNNAGVGIGSSILGATYNDWDWAIAVNLIGVVNGIQCFLPKMLAHGEGGHIVTTASSSGLAVAPGSGVYTTTKFAVVGMMESLRAELAPRGVGVSVFCPGLVRTNLLETEDARPSRYKEPNRRLPRQLRQRIQREVIDYGMDPLEAGQHVLEGIRHNDLYVLSHPEFETIIRQRFDAIMRSFPRNAKVPNARLRAEAGMLTSRAYQV